MSRTRHILSLACNAVVILLVAFSVVSFFFRTGDGNMAVMGVYCFRFFTIDSNILCALTCVFVIPFNIRGLKSGRVQASYGEFNAKDPAGREAAIPKWVLICKFIGTAAVSLTFLVVMCFLGPILGYDAMFSGNNLFMHGICPILAIASFMFAERGALRFRCTWLALLPTLIYGLLYMTMVVIVGVDNGGWPDFYMFNATGMWPLTFVTLMAASFVIAVLLRLPHRAGRNKG